MSDRLEIMFEQQRMFVKLLQKTRGFPDVPVDITSKSGQKLLADISHHCTDELHEARQLLKNSKTHRATDIREFDRASYIEELADVLHLYFEIIIASGISLDELVDEYIRKGDVNMTRIESGY